MEESPAPPRVSERASERGQMDGGRRRAVATATVTAACCYQRQSWRGTAVAAATMVRDGLWRWRRLRTSVSSASRFSSSESDLFSTTLTAYLVPSLRCSALCTTEKRPLRMHARAHAYVRPDAVGAAVRESGGKKKWQSGGQRAHRPSSSPSLYMVLTLSTMCCEQAHARMKCGQARFASGVWPRGARVTQLL